MARKIDEKKGYKKAIRNRGEDIGYPAPPVNGYDYMPEDQYSDRAQERSTRRHEVRRSYAQMYDLEQERDQRAFARLRDMDNEFFAGVDPRRKKELADGGMVREDHNAMSNLPRQAIHCEYPQAPFYESQYIDNALRGIDDELDDDGNSMRRFR